MRVWSTLGFVFVGTYPRDYGARTIVNFEERRFVPEIGMDAYGYIDYERDLPRREQELYGLWPEKGTDQRTEGATGELARASQANGMSKAGETIGMTNRAIRRES